MLIFLAFYYKCDVILYTWAQFPDSGFLSKSEKYMPYAIIAHLFSYGIRVLHE